MCVILVPGHHGIVRVLWLAIGPHESVNFVPWFMSNFRPRRIACLPLSGAVAECLTPSPLPLLTSYSTTPVHRGVSLFFDLKLTAVMSFVFFFVELLTDTGN